MRPLLAVATALLRHPDSCAERLRRALDAAAAEPRVAEAAPDEPIRQDRAVARVFWALRDAGCEEAYLRWERGEMPAACRGQLDAFRSAGVPEPAAPLAPWREPVPPNSSAIAFLVSVADPEALPLVLRTYRRLHRPGDRFVYLVDAAAAPGYAPHLSAALEKAVPGGGAKVVAAQHSVMYFWPRVEAVLGGLQALVSDGDWSYVVHLSEHDYPLRPAALRALAAKREPRERTLVLDAVPRSRGGHADTWYWWKERTAVFACGGRAVPDPAVVFPDDALASRYALHRGSEWFALPREAAEYVVADAEAARGVRAFEEVFQHRWSVDEVFWPTLLQSIPGLQRPVKAGWYVEWDEQHGHSPDTFVGPTLARHRHSILASDRLFVRKVSLPGSKDLLDTLDTRP